MLRLNRQEESADGTFGVLLISGHVFCVTLEPPDNDNQKNISNIPPGRYICKRIISPKYGVVFEITGVPGRTHVLIHPGNRAKDTEGCIIVAQHFGKLHGDRAVLNSGATYRKFMDHMNGLDECTIDIVDPVEV